MDPANLSGPDSDREEGEDHEILFSPRTQDIVITPSSPGKVQAVPDCDIANMVKTLNGAIAAVSQDTARIQRAYQQLCTKNIMRDKALADLTTMVRECGSSPAATQPYGPPTPAARPRPAMQADVLDADGNLRAADIGITWEDNETFLHGVRVVGPKFSRPTGHLDGDRNSSSMITQPPTPGTPVIPPDRDVHLHRPSPEARQGYQSGRTNTAIQQQIPQLAGVVSSFPGSGGRPRLEQGPESVTTSVLPRRDRHECGPRTGRQRSLQLRRAGQAIK